MIILKNRWRSKPIMSTQYVKLKETDLMQLTFAVYAFAKKFNRYPDLANDEKHEFILLKDFSLYYDQDTNPRFIKFASQDNRVWIKNIKSQKLIDLLTEEINQFL